MALRKLRNSKNETKGAILATLMGGIILTGGIGLYNLNKDLDELSKQNLNLTKQIETLNQDLTAKDNNIKSLDESNKKLNSNIEDLNKEKEQLIKDKDYLKKELDKAKKEVSAKEKQLRLAEYPTNKSRVNSSTASKSNSNNTNKKGTPITMTLTFYGDFAHENGGYAGIDAQGNKLVAGTVASNVHSFGTKFELNGQIFTVRDRGGKNFNSSNRLDVFVPRLPGESNSAYSARIRKYGRKTVTMYKL